jgi:hypothetical protein
MWLWVLSTAICVWWAIDEPDAGNRAFLILLACITATMGTVRGCQLWREERRVRRGS